MEMQYLNIDNARLDTTLPEESKLRLEAHIELDSNWLAISWFTMVAAGSWEDESDAPWFNPALVKKPIRKSKP